MATERSTTTTTSAAAAPALLLTEVQRLALTIAEAGGWGVTVEAGDGSRVQLRRGRPDCALIICLGAGELPPVTAEETYTL